MAVLNREDLERREHDTLSHYAAFSDETLGRDKKSLLDGSRTEYQRDRDRILHCKAFRRLSHKTQVFLAPLGDHYRTRLTHTLEVAQISRTIARALALNEDLTEAIALGHDLGHTPFGHTGEDALSGCIATYLGKDVGDKHEYYKHNEQSLRVAEILEYGGKGLNLTHEVRDGILCHTGATRAKTFEGKIVATADRIAYVNHDIDDAIRAGIISEGDLPYSAHEVLGSHHAARITTLINDMVHESDRIGDIQMSAPVWDAMMELREYLFHNVYLHPEILGELSKATGIVEALFSYFIEHTDQVPLECREIAQAHPSSATFNDPICTAVVDYIAGMTDRYARNIYTELFIPRSW
ncbi:MAG: deoxyguanosinetriphosphate triphosphohydrolase [Actinobacteria bacterium]|nr:deoxyguanosinetriphosphate triphosphohydrolase [Actinomycetota bacterium]